MMEDAILAKILEMGADLFLLSLKIGAPVIATLAFVSVGFGLTAKFSPQMNVMIVAFPLKIIFGLLLFGLVFQIILIVTKGYIADFKTLLMTLLYYAGGNA